MEYQIKLNPSNIVAVDVYLENRKTRNYVGRLKYKGKNQDIEKDDFIFEYDPRYLYAKTSIPLGPDIPLTKKIHQSAHLFKSLVDRIPSTDNPEYKMYCKSVGISPQEKNQIILLATIGRRGPSSFILEPVYRNEMPLEKIKTFRKDLGLTIREYALVFDFSTTSVLKMEDAKLTDSLRKDILKRVFIYYKFPEVALYEVMLRGNVLKDDKKKRLIDKLNSRLKEVRNK